MLIPDHETEVDFLNYETVSGTVARILRAKRNHPLTIGIHGHWGAGKSSILRMIESELSSDERMAVLWFNAWAFEGFDDAKTVLIKSTITELCRHRTLPGKAQELAASLIRRIDWLKAAKRGSGILLNALLGVPSPDQVQSARDSLASAARNAGQGGGAGIAGQLEEVAGFLKPGEADRNVPDTIQAFRAEFMDMLDEANIDQLVILIDDLDRCLPTTAIETLEAIRLFLFAPKSAFVIAADETMIEYSVRQHFPDLPQASGPFSYTRNYLEKIIQIPFRIPALGAQEIQTYVLLLLVQNTVGENHPGFKVLVDKAKRNLEKPWLGGNLSLSEVRAVDVGKKAELDSAFDLANQIAPVLAEGTKGNPRQVKRFINTLLVRHEIAGARGFGGAIRQPVLAKMMLAELFQADFYDQVALQAMASKNGRSADLTMLESSVKESDDGLKNAFFERSLDDASDNAAKRSSWPEYNWLRSWVDIQPSIGDIDLRPYIFVSRDKRVMLGSAEDSTESLINILCGTKMEIRTADLEIQTLTPEDASIVFSGVRERVLTAEGFSEKPSGMDGLTVLAKYHPRLQIELVKLVSSLDPKEIGSWATSGWIDVIADMEAMAHMRALFQEWSQQDDNVMLKRSAATIIMSMQRGAD